jgi:hypothetical protein
LPDGHVNGPSGNRIAGRISYQSVTP